MNKIYSFFKFLEEKRGKRIPFILKLVYAPEDIKEEELTVKGTLDLRSTKITSLPNNLKVEGNLYLMNTSITSLPDNLTVNGYLDLEGTKITSLPDNLTVEGSLNLRHTRINSLPKNLRVGGVLYLGGTPLSKKYNKEEIRRMIEDKGGSVGDSIYT